MKQIRPVELKAWLADGAKPRLLDVREAWEHQRARIENSTLIPMGEIAVRIAELDAAQDIVIICHHGGRSMQIAGYLERQGFTSVYNLAGGVDAWARTVDPSMQVY